MVKIGGLFLKGCLLGLSMVFPGLSGGTVAFILNIYKKIIDEISKFNYQNLKLLFPLFPVTKSLPRFLKIFHWKFLWPLLLGVLFSSICFIYFSLSFIERYRLMFYILILILVILSLYDPFRKMNKNKETFSLLTLSFIFNLLFFYWAQKEVLLVREELFVLWFFPLGGLLALSFIVPGLSGSYVLVLFGVYELTIRHIQSFEWLPILLLFLGFVFGLLGVARLMKVVFEKHYHKTLAVILGLILGSLYSLWSVIQGELI